MPHVVIEDATDLATACKGLSLSVTRNGAEILKLVDVYLNRLNRTALIDCAQTCSDSACEAACESAHPTGTTKMTALSTCANTACGATCGGPPSGPGPGPASCGLTSGVATCDTCLDASCCAPTSACLADPDCTAIVGCYDACSDAACAAACDAAHPTGSSKLTAVFTCLQTSCASTCGF